MPAKVLIPPPYRGPTHGEAHLVVEAGSVRACLEAVERKFPGFLPQVLDDKGAVHRFVKLFLNGDLLDPKRLDRAVADGDELEIVAAIAGG
jgi:molybdopterin converting factor small subunit